MFRFTSTLGLSLMCLAFLLPTQDADAKRKRRSKKTKTPVVDPAVAQEVREIYDAVSSSANSQARLAAVKGRLEIGGEDQKKAIEDALKSADAQLKLFGYRTILQNPKTYKSELKGTYTAIKNLLGSKDAEERKTASTLIDEFFKKRDKEKAWAQALKQGSAAAQKAARLRIIARKDRSAWKLVSKGLSAPQDSEIHKEALTALREHPYPKAVKWVMNHAGDRNEQGEVARLWISKAKGREVKKMTKKLMKQYEKAFKSNDFPRRVQLAHLLASRGKVKEVQETLRVAVVNKRGIIKEELDSAEIRVLGWQGLKKCRSHKILNNVKDMMINLKNRVEAAPAVDWLVDWIQDTRDPKALAVLEGMVRQTQYVSRIESVRALGLLKSRKSWDLIVNALINDDENMRFVAAQSLATMAERGDEKKLHKYLLNERKSKRVRLALLEGVRNINSPETLKTARYWLTDRDPEIRSICIEIMDKFGQDKEFRLLSRKLNDPDVNVRLQVWVIFMKKKDPKIIRQFKQARYWMTPDHVKTLVNHPKLKLHKDMLNQLLVSLALNGSVEIRTLILDLFAQRGPETLPLIEELFKESVEPELSAETFKIYRQFQKEKGMEMYMKQIKNRYAPVRAVAFQALRRYAQADVLEQVKTAMTNERSDYPRAEAARAFVQIGLRKPASK